MTKYYVYFGTGAGDLVSNQELDVLMAEVTDEITYTGESISITDEDKNVVASLPWYGVKAEEDDIVTADFGDFGFYGEWVIA